MAFHFFVLTQWLQTWRYLSQTKDFYKIQGCGFTGFNRSAMHKVRAFGGPSKVDPIVNRPSEADPISLANFWSAVSLKGTLGAVRDCNLKHWEHTLYVAYF